MKFQKTYSAEEFADQVGEKVANIRAFRLFARELNLIQNHELLTEAFLPAWDIAQKLHYENNVKWENAMKHGLSEVFGVTVNQSSSEKESATTTNIDEKLDEIIVYLKRIVTALEK